MFYDLAIIVGRSTALEISRLTGLSIVVLEKEVEVATHQTGRNSGVIHAGVYYQPGSLKARFCREGVEATVKFCREYGIPFEQCGKMLVATGFDQMPRLAALQERCRQNGLPVERLDAKELVRSSSRRTVWLSDDCDVPSSAAARVKLRSSATVRKAKRSPSSSRFIH